jgi:hypothetical protein
MGTCFQLSGTAFSLAKKAFQAKNANVDEVQG